MEEGAGQGRGRAADSCDVSGDAKDQKGYRSSRLAGAKMFFDSV